MGTQIRRIATCMVGIVAVTLSVTGSSAGSEPAASPAGGGTAPAMSLAAPFTNTVTPTAEQLNAAASSRTRYAHMNRTEAARLAAGVFHVARSPLPSSVPAGSRVGSYFGNNAAVERLPSGHHVVLSSTVPLRVDTGGGLAPTSLTLERTDATFVAANPVVPVAISTNLREGVKFQGGLTVVPTATHTEPPVVAGDSVVFANTETDTDTIAEPRPDGVEISWQLRSSHSPSSEALKFNLPPGTKLEPSSSYPGAVELVADGVPAALIPPATAQDAMGQSVPTWYQIKDSTLVVTISPQADALFPILVDPTVYIFAGHYGNSFSSFAWTGWTNERSCTCFAMNEAPGLISMGANPGAPFEAYGLFSIFAPGTTGKPGSAGITRVDLTNVSHSGGESRLVGKMIEPNGAVPIYSYNPAAGASGPLPLNEYASLSNQAIAFCAQQSGGTGAALCNEVENQAHGFYIADQITSATQKEFNGVSVEGATVTYRDPAPPNAVTLNTAGYAGEWMQHGPKTFSITAEDEGLGIMGVELQAPAGKAFFAQTVNCRSREGGLLGDGFSGCPTSFTSSPINLAPLVGTGEFQLAPSAEDAAEDNARPAASRVAIYLDQTAPAISESTGSLAEAPGGVIGGGNYQLNFSAQDGSSTSPQSGVKTLEVEVNSEVVYSETTKCAQPKGLPITSCFGLTGSWVMNGEEWGAGEHQVAVVARDWAGNVERQTKTITVSESASQTVGPGAVNLETGDFKTSTNDVSIPGGEGAQLTVGRSYDSHAAGELEGPLGTTWALNLPDGSVAGQWQQLTELPNKAVTVETAQGQRITFTRGSEESYRPPIGYPADVLKKSGESYELSDAHGAVTTFTRPEGAGEIYVPSSAALAAGAGGLDKVKYTFVRNTLNQLQPSEVLGPEPSEGACSPTLVRGCRALTFNYALATTATGEARSQWGDYLRLLTRVYFTAWDPEAGKMKTTTVAQYAYDNRGRLRAEWDPRISPTLTTTYGYDTEDNLTAATSPGEQPWLLQYAKSFGAPGVPYYYKLEAATRPPAATPVWSGESLTNTAAPVISGSAVTTVKLSVSTGSWSVIPGTMTYQWEDCPAGGGACTPIQGGINPTYTAGESDVGMRLAATVTATNGGGSLSVATARTAVVEKKAAQKVVEGTAPTPAAPRWTVEYGVPVAGSAAPYALGAKEVKAWGQGDVPTEGTAIFPPDEPAEWPAHEYKRATIFYLDAGAHTVNAATPGGGISVAEYEPRGNLVRTLTADNRARAVTSEKPAEEALALSTTNSFSAGGTDLTMVRGPRHLVKLANGAEVEAQKETRYYYDEGAPEGGPYNLVTKSVESALIGGEEEVDARTVKQTYSTLGWKLHAPATVSTTTGEQSIVSSAVYGGTTGAPVEEYSPSANALQVYSGQFGKFGSEAGRLTNPNGITTDPSGNTWVSDAGDNRLSEYSSTGSAVLSIGWGVLDGKEELEVCKATCKAGIAGLGKGQLSAPQGVAYDLVTKDLYVTDSGNNRVVVYTPAGAFVRAFGESGKALGQFNSPHGIVAEPAGNIWIADQSNSRVVQYTSEGAAVVAYGKEGKGNLEFSGTGDVTTCGGNIYITDFAGQRVEEMTTGGAYVRQFGRAGKENGQFTQVSRIACDSANKYLYVTDKGGNRVEVFTLFGAFVGTLGSAGAGNGQLNSPIGVTVTGGAVEVVDSSNARIEEWNATNPSAHGRQTIYYSAGGNASYPECGGHVEWAGMACQVQPLAQPGTSGQPELPVTKFSYNLWDEPVTTKETSGAATRTTTVTYDPAGRTLTTAIAGAGVALPVITNEYSAETGAVVKESSPTTSISSEYNKLGQLTAYTDASGNVTSYTYEPSEDYRLLKVSDGKGTQTYTYDGITGMISQLTDSAAGVFTAKYDAEGKLTVAGLPDGLTARYKYNPVGQPIGLEYEKATHCGVSCIWFADAVVPSIHGQWMTQGSTFSSQSYAYDGVGRLVNVQDTPVGGGCTTRLYSYDVDGNRTSLTTRPPGTEGKCATEGGTSQAYSYDTAARLDDSGVGYDPWGNTTAVPAADAGGTSLVSTYYTDDTQATQEQNGEKISYALDPAGRVREAVFTGTTSAVVTDHYGAPGDSPSWSGSGSGWTRYIGGIGGSLGAIQSSGLAPVLQLANLHGDVVATAADNETEAKLLTTSDPTEYGVPRASSTSQYSWLGADRRATELPTGIVAMGRRSYVPELGRFTQTDPQAGGSANAYAYTFDDPVNEADTSGEFSSSVTYDYAAAEVGQAPGGIAEQYAGPGAVAPPPVDLQLEAAADAQVAREGFDPYICCGVYVAFFLTHTQIHFNFHDSVFLAAATFSTIVKFAAALPPPWDFVAVAVASGIAAVVASEVAHHNCIQIEDPLLGLPSVGLYRSKKECG
jgi:RHS repeat-associated protein